MGKARGLAAEMQAAGIEPGASIRDQLAGPEQAALFEAEAAEHVDDLEAGGIVPAAIQRRRGRRPGSRNKATADMIEFMRAVGYEDPLAYMYRAITMTPQELADWAKIGDKLPTPDTVLSHQRYCAKQLADYVHTKKPVEITGKDGHPIFVMGAHLGGPDGEPDIRADGHTLADEGDMSPLPANSITYDDDEDRGHSGQGSHE